MKATTVFERYAAAFEKAVIDDDWSSLGNHFAADAVYEGADGVAEGNSAVIEKLARGVAELDRRFDSRELVEINVSELGHMVTLRK